MGPAGIYGSKPIQSRVSVLEGDFASIGLPLCLCVQLQVSWRYLKLDEALWTARSTPDGFSVSLFWPAPENVMDPRERRGGELRLVK